MNPPHWSLAVSEAPRALIEFGTLILLRNALLNKLPLGDGHGVMVIPGFMGDDPYNRSLVGFLNKLGYRASGWEMGRNLGVKSFSADNLRVKLKRLAQRGGGPVSLIGHSLGGIYAREIARMEPGAIRQVISLGTPFGEGRDSGSHASRFHKRLNPSYEADPNLQHLEDGLPVAPPVPTTAIYTKADGIVTWRTTIQEDGHQQTQCQRDSLVAASERNSSRWYSGLFRVVLPISRTE